jgi:hypothetical protein
MCLFCLDRETRWVDGMSRAVWPAWLLTGQGRAGQGVAGRCLRPGILESLAHIGTPIYIGSATSHITSAPNLMAG